jgi:N-methylhydantoinase B
MASHRKRSSGNAKANRRAPEPSKTRVKMDAVTLGIVQNHLSTYADEMANTVMRTAYSTIVRDAMDFSTALCDAQGQTVAQGLTVPFHLGSIHHALGYVIQKYESRIYPGDIFILNDPFGGGIHLPDIFLFKPIFYQGERIGFAAAVSHHVDVGGRVPGSSACDSTEVFQEGLRIPALKFYERGEPSEALFQLLEKNVRVPTLVLGDIRANLAALGTGEKGFLELAERYGKKVLKAYLAELLDYTERLARAEIQSWPDGEYKFTDYLDDDGVNPDSIPFHVKITVKGNSLTVDFAGTSPQVRGALNSPLPFTKSAVGYAVRSVMQADIPHTSGLFRAIEIKAPLRSILNPVMPAASAMRGVTGFRLADTVLGALAQAVPARVPAAGEGGVSLVFIGGYEANGEAFVMSDLIAGTWGGRPTKDGIDGITNPAAVVSNIPAELMELEYPVRVEQYGLIQDTGGAGKYRGGLALIRDWRFVGEEATVSTRSDRRKHRPYGLQGGLSGAPSSFEVFEVIANGKATVRGTKDTFQIRRGDLIRHRTAGGGGWGNPLERDPQMVLKDVLYEKVSVARARELYGVVVDAERLQIDDEATRLLRTEKRKNGGK